MRDPDTGIDVGDLPQTLTGPLPYAAALRAWCAGAAANGAYVPTELGWLVGSQHTPATLPELLRHAEWAADFCSAVEWAASGVSDSRGAIRPARPIVLGAGALVWRTSVDLALVLAEDGWWHVTLSAPHPHRESAVHRHLVPAADSDRW